MKSAIICLLAVAASALRFSGNVSFNEEADFVFRESSLGLAGVMQKNILYYTSASVEAHADEANANATADFLLGVVESGAGLIPELKFVPTALLAYFGGSGKVTPTEGVFDMATGVSAMSYLSLSEMTEDNELVKEYPLQGFSEWSEVSVDDEDGNLRSTSASGTINGATVTITAITSDVVGKINLAKGVVAPKAIEMVIQIRDYDFADSSNHLRLKLISGVANATASGNALISGADDGMYATLSSHCYCGSFKKEVTISEYVATDKEFSFAASIVGTLNVDVREVHIDFPKGKGKIDYDPALGHGALVYGASSALFPSLVLLLALLSMLFF